MPLFEHKLWCNKAKYSMVLVIKSNETCDDDSYCIREIPTWHGNDVRKLVIFPHSYHQKEDDHQKRR